MHRAGSLTPSVAQVGRVTHQVEASVNCAKKVTSLSPPRPSHETGEIQRRLPKAGFLRDCATAGLTPWAIAQARGGSSSVILSKLAAMVR